MAEPTALFVFILFFIVFTRNISDCETLLPLVDSPLLSGDAIMMAMCLMAILLMMMMRMIMATVWLLRVISIYYILMVIHSFTMSINVYDCLQLFLSLCCTSGGYCCGVWLRVWYPHLHPSVSSGWMIILHSGQVHDIESEHYPL